MTRYCSILILVSLNIRIDKSPANLQIPTLSQFMNISYEYQYQL